MQMKLRAQGSEFFTRPKSEQHFMFFQSTKLE